MAKGEEDTEFSAVEVVIVDSEVVIAVKTVQVTTGKVLAQVSISPTFYELLFHTKVFFIALT